MGRRVLGRQGGELQVYKIASSRGQAMYVSRACGAIIGRADADCSGAPQLALGGTLRAWRAWASHRAQCTGRQAMTALVMLERCLSRWRIARNVAPC